LSRVSGSVLEDATVISRSHLPRMLAKLDWQDLNEVINQCFSDKTAQITEALDQFLPWNLTEKIKPLK
jgi:hypothetical protein